MCEPLVDDACPADVARLLGAALETTRADINAATLAKDSGEERLISLSRTGIRLNAAHLAGLRSAIEDLLWEAREHPDEDGAWTTVLWTAVDRGGAANGGCGAGRALGGAGHAGNYVVVATP